MKKNEVPSIDEWDWKMWLIAIVGVVLQIPVVCFIYKIMVSLAAQ